MPAISLVPALPPFISPAEYAAVAGDRTPASFAAIPPICRHQEPAVRLLLDPPVPDAQFAAEDAQAGTLYVLESALIFAATTGKVLSVPYPAITLHAVSRSDEGPSIYCQLDESDPEAPEPEDDEASPMRELSLIPANPDSLELIFEALSLCASLHPDPADADDDMLDSDAFIDAETDGPFEVFTGDGDEELSAVGRAALEHLESIIVYSNPALNPDAATDATESVELNSVNGVSDDSSHPTSPSEKLAQ